MPPTRVCVAQIGAPHGVRGEVRLRVFTKDPLAITRYGPLEAEDGARRIKIASLRPGKSHFIARLDGVEDRAAAERLTNLHLFVPRERLPPPDDEETFYHADLIGLAAVNRAGVRIGKIVAVQNFGAGDLLEIEPISARAAVLVPFTAAVVPAVDVASGRIVVDPPEGLLDELGPEALPPPSSLSRKSRSSSARKRNPGGGDRPRGEGGGRPPGED